MKRFRWLLGAAALAGVALTLYAFNPVDGPFPYPRCLFRELTGWDCPGCGSARALHALLHGRLAAAWALNPMLLPLAAAGVGALAVDRFGSAQLRRRVFSPGAVAVLCAAVLAWTVIRNL